MTKAEVMAWLRRERLVPVVRANSPDRALAMIDALYEGGIRIFEVTTTVPNTLEVIRTTAETYGDRILLGAGTVLDEKTAEDCLDAGAQFIVSPAFDPLVVAFCQRRQVVCAPGALSPSEILTAWRAGADIVKVFPCDALGGASYLNALRAPLAGIPLMPTGGVTLEALPSYLAAGALAVGVGGALVDPELGREKLIERARDFVRCIDPL